MGDLGSTLNTKDSPKKKLSKNKREAVVALAKRHKLLEELTAARVAVIKKAISKDEKFASAVQKALLKKI